MYTIYFQISNSKNIAQPNGTQHTQRKQLEVLQACTDNGGAYQLIRTQSSSRWSSSTSVSPAVNSDNSSSPTTTTKNPNHDHNDVRIEDDYNDIDDDCIDVTETATTTTTTPHNKSNDNIPIIKVTETTPRATNNNVKADHDVVSLNGLEICEVSDTEIANVDFIDCNGIVVDADDIVETVIMDNDDDDHDHEVYYHGKRVFDIKVQLADDYEHPTITKQPISTQPKQPTVNGNNHINYKNYNNKNMNSNNHNNNNNSSTHNKNKTAQSNKNNHSLHTTPSVKLSNLMVSTTTTTTKTNINQANNQ